MTQMAEESAMVLMWFQYVDCNWDVLATVSFVVAAAETFVLKADADDL